MKRFAQTTVRRVVSNVGIPALSSSPGTTWRKAATRPHDCDRPSPFGTIAQPWRLVRRWRQLRRRAESVARIIEVVFWRNSIGGLVAGPGACPHLGAPLDECPVLDGTMYCRWHGLALRQSGDQTWSPYRAHDDGVLIWVGLPSDGEVATDRPRTPRARHCPNLSALSSRSPASVNPRT